MPDGDYTSYTGTLMASPDVMGMAVLLPVNGTLTDLGGDGTINNEDVRPLLQQTADDMGTTGKDKE